MGSIALFFPLLLAVFLPLLLIILAIIITVFLKNSKFDFEIEKQNNYGIESITRKGEAVKSIGEKTIADYFERNRINYVYEQRDKFHSFVPDFYLPDYNVYVEYWGLVNADDNWTKNRYVRHMKRKMAIYYKNNVKFVSIYP